MTDIPEELVERVADIIWHCDPEEGELRQSALAAIRAVLDWQAKEWVEIPGLDRGGE